MLTSWDLGEECDSDRPLHPQPVCLSGGLRSQLSRNEPLAPSPSSTESHHLECVVLFEQEGLHFHFALSPSASAAFPDTESFFLSRAPLLPLLPKTPSLPYVFTSIPEWTSSYQRVLVPSICRLKLPSTDLRLLLPSLSLSFPLSHSSRKLSSASISTSSQHTPSSTLLSVREPPALLPGACFHGHWMPGPGLFQSLASCGTSFPLVLKAPPFWVFLLQAVCFWSGSFPRSSLPSLKCWGFFTHTHTHTHGESYLCPYRL